MTIHDVPEQLVDTWTRLYRAKENYDALGDEVTSFLYEYVKGMIKGWNRESESFVLQFRHPRDSVMTGKPRALVVDIVEDLRSSLDYMVFELSVLNTPDLTESTSQFVIADTKKHFDQQSKRRLRYLTYEQRTEFIERLQPFNGNPMLALLRNIANQSKHRRLLSLRDNSGWDIYMDDIKNRDKYKNCFVYPMEKGQVIFTAPKNYTILLLEKYDALGILKEMAEHVGDVVRLSHCFFEGRPFKMTIIPSAT